MIGNLKSAVTMVMVVIMMAMLMNSSESKCEFQAIFNFGDSNSDTGGFWAAFPAQGPPYGMTYFKKPSGRASDGRLVIDFLVRQYCMKDRRASWNNVAQAIGVPFLSPYLQSVGSNYKHGANFATLASTVLQPSTSLFVSGISPFYLAIQLNQLKQLHSLAHQPHSHRGATKLPHRDVFKKSLYVFYIGQNDFTGNLAAIGIKGVQQYLPDVVNQISYAIKEINGMGGRTFMVLNIAPIGCYPAFLEELPHDESDIDQFGCLISYNNAVVEYNTMLKDTLFQLKKQLSNADVIYVDIHSVMLELFQHPTHHGLSHGPTACCGVEGNKHKFNPQVFCGNTKVLNGNNVTAEACSDPHNYVSWDGIHATEAANKIVTGAILSGSYFDPPFDFHKFCDIQPIG